MDTFIHYGMAASIQAVRDAGLPTGDALDEATAERIGVLVGSGKAWPPRKYIGKPGLACGDRSRREDDSRLSAPFCVEVSRCVMVGFMDLPPTAQTYRSTTRECQCNREDSESTAPCAVFLGLVAGVNYLGRRPPHLHHAH